MQRVRSGIIIICFSLLILGASSAVYLNDHAWGTWGDDSAGYIFLAGRLAAKQPLVYQDPLIHDAISIFGDVRLTKWLAPTHHDFINPDGTMASRYPIGASLLYWLAALITGETINWYVVTPLLAALNLVLVYWLALRLWSDERWRHVIGGLAALGLGMTELYYDYAIAQPMREIPVTTFCLLAVLCLTEIISCIRNNGRRLVMGMWSIGLGLSLAMAINIRETSIVFAVMCLISGLVALHPEKKTINPSITASRFRWPSVVYGVIGVTALITFLGLTPSIYNSVTISQSKVAFKARDVSSVAVLPNLDHIQSFGISNLFTSNGKFKPVQGGGLPYYWFIVGDTTPAPYWWLLVVGGAVALYHKPAQRWQLALLAGWGISSVFIFALWINPYSRYIIPVLPVWFLLGSLGLIRLCTTWLPRWFASMRNPRLWQGTMIVLITVQIVLGYQSTGQAISKNMQTDVQRFKAISHSDFTNIEYIGQQLSTDSVQPLLMFSGKWQYGTSETFEAHTQIKTIRFPFEQPRTQFNTQHVEQVLTQLIPRHGYTLYVWTDSTSSAQIFEWLQAHQATRLTQATFSFEPMVTIWKVNQ